MAPLGICLDAIGIDPGNGRRHHTEVQMIDHRMCIARLAFGAADLLPDLLEPGFDLPTCPVILDDLLGRECQAGAEESDSLVQYEMSLKVGRISSMR